MIMMISIRFTNSPIIATVVVVGVNYWFVCFLGGLSLTIFSCFDRQLV